MATVTCRTEECPNQGAGIELVLTYEDEEGATVAVDAVVCGVCGQPITDIANDERKQRA